MKKFNVEAKLVNTGVKVSTKVYAESADDAELVAGRKFLEAGWKGDQIKIVSID